EAAPAKPPIAAEPFPAPAPAAAPQPAPPFPAPGPPEPPPSLSAPLVSPAPQLRTYEEDIPTTPVKRNATVWVIMGVAVLILVVVGIKVLIGGGGDETGT